MAETSISVGAGIEPLMQAARYEDIARTALAAANASDFDASSQLQRLRSAYLVERGKCYLTVYDPRSTSEVFRMYDLAIHTHYR